MQQLINELKQTFPDLQFCETDRFYWSPADKHICYKLSTSRTYKWKLLHEVGHALLEHQTYRSDFELLRLEVEAWDKARQLAKKFKIKITEDYIQDCLDTYRDWLDRRSTCPYCTSRSAQENLESYRCFNCNAAWRVSPSRFCRTYRQINRGNKKPPTYRQAIFS